jgi:hypothetical protein
MRGRYLRLDREAVIGRMAWPLVASLGRAMDTGAGMEVVARLVSLRQHQRNGQRSPHKPLLVLLALGGWPLPDLAGCRGRWPSRCWLS